MTYSTLSLREYPAAVTQAELESSATKSKQLWDWDHRSRDCYPHDLSGWARSHDIPAFFVDNEFVRVPVTAAQLLVFAKEILGVSDAAALERRAVEAEGSVVIEAEAF
jgi:hypothetical protein